MATEVNTSYYNFRILTTIKEDSMKPLGCNVFELSQKSIQLINNMWRMAPIQMSSAINRLSDTIVSETKYNCVSIDIGHDIENHLPVLRRIVLSQV